MSERMTTAEEHAETIREFVVAQDEPSDFVLSALAAMEGQIKALADALVLHSKRLQCSVCGGVGAHEAIEGVWFCPKGPTFAHPDVEAALRLAGRLP